MHQVLGWQQSCLYRYTQLVLSLHQALGLSELRLWTRTYGIMVNEATARAALLERWCAAMWCGRRIIYTMGTHMHETGAHKQTTHNVRTQQSRCQCSTVAYVTL